MNDSIATSLEIYRKLEQKRYDHLTPAEQKIVRLGAAAIACQNVIEEGRTDNYNEMEFMLEDFLSQLEIAISQLPEDNSKSRS